MKNLSFVFSRNLLVAGIILFVVLLQSACVTKYGPKNWKGGYEDMALGENKFQVEFIANGYTKTAQQSNIYFIVVLRLQKKMALTTLLCWKKIISQPAVCREVLGQVAFRAMKLLNRPILM